ncbi:hypothetical protein [Acetobacter oeni]|uniref:Uncharacterized protein n=1 Tax=Acetobacter oeni TaxID=304077 RepID=A0A511XLW0_9PROT|nr:hypothetical protein [Acetobacter oeni]MBB3882951.1 hypothetical protein [Acetobacter oeni]NHO19033.1 hypothetical protein [Acetobacter oeni]GBR09285.1 hypothetical protein AA21952_2815 [Acetobacter oeni LMG 21952]GEN63927.1 hypothetical protein AOE01nite_21510 [Acetobacter oeni]
MDTSSILNAIFRLIPPSWLATATALASFIIAGCALALRFWKPPAKNSHWAIVYRVVSALAQARGWNASAYQPDRKAIMIPVSTDRSEVAENLGLKVDETRP